MPGSAQEFDYDGDNDLRLDRPKTSRVEEVHDVTIPAVDLEKIASEDIPVPMPPPAPSADAIAAPPVPTEPKRQATAFSTSTATPYELDRILIEVYGTDWLEWLPETLWATLREDFETQLSALNRDKVSAAKLLHLNDAFWRYWETFEKVVVAFNNLTPLFDRVQDLSVGQMVWAVRQANEIRKEPFEEEVARYVAARAKEEGFVWLPPPLEFAQPFLDTLVPPEIVPLHKEVRERWEALEGTDFDKIELKEDFFGVQLARLAGIDRYVQSMSRPEEESE